MPMLDMTRRPADLAKAGSSVRDPAEQEANAVAEHAAVDRPGFDFGNVKIHADGGGPPDFLSGGETLDHGVRGVMESRLGFPLDGVRVHRGDAAATATTALNARAFTFGRDIAFAPGEFRPDTSSGRRLLAHELTHVAQQTQAGTSRVQRQPKPAPEPWETQIDDVLPPGGGLVLHMHRIGQLTDRFSVAELNELIGLIHANADAKKLTREYAGVPGIFALHETRVGKKLDPVAARFLIDKFPAKPTPRKSDETKAEVFSDAVVREAYVRFHYNALLPSSSAQFTADMPAEVRRNCIAIIHEMAPKLLTSKSAVTKANEKFQKLREKSATHTMVHTGDAMADIGVAEARTEIKFKDAAGKATNGNTEPAALVSSAWDKVIEKVGKDYGWHIFGMAMMDGYHSVTLFVDNQPGGAEVYWADQWRIDAGDDFAQLPGSASGFRKYDKAGFDKFIQDQTNTWWKNVHSADSKCGKAHGNKWETACRYNATLMLWHLRKTPK